MKVIIIEEKDIKALMERLELEKFQLNQRRDHVDEMNRRFHYVVCSWFQEQGSSYPN